MLPICLALSLGTPAGSAAPAPVIAPAALAQEGIFDDLTGDAPWHTLRWTWFQFDSQFGDPDGWRASGNFSLDENVYLFGNWAFVQEDGASGDDMTLGLGYHDELAALDDVFSESEWFTRLGFRNTDVNAPTGASAQEFGFELAGGVRSILAERIEAELTFGYRETFEAEFFGTLRGEYEVSRNLAASVALDVGDEETLLVGLRYYPNAND